MKVRSLGELAPLWSDPSRRMRVAGLVSGSGSGLRAVLEQQAEFDRAGAAPYEVVGIFSDDPRSRARALGDEFGIPVHVEDIRAFYRVRGAPIRDRGVRREFDLETCRFLDGLGVDVLVYCYVWATTSPLVDGFLGVNVHPGDLSIEQKGRRRYAGARAVEDALRAGEACLASTAHLVTADVDAGPLLMISPAVPVHYPLRADFQRECRHYLALLNAHKKLLFPRTILELASAGFARSADGTIHLRREPIPGGYRIATEVSAPRMRHQGARS